MGRLSPEKLAEASRRFEELAHKRAADLRATVLRDMGQPEGVPAEPAPEPQEEAGSMAAATPAAAAAGDGTAPPGSLAAATPGGAAKPRGVLKVHAPESTGGHSMHNVGFCALITGYDDKGQMEQWEVRLPLGESDPQKGSCRRSKTPIPRGGHAAVRPETPPPPQAARPKPSPKPPAGQVPPTPPPSFTPWSTDPVKMGAASGLAV